MRWAILLLALGACQVSTDAGCTIYGGERLSMPRPLPDDTLGQWVGRLDTKMTSGCR